MNKNIKKKITGMIESLQAELAKDNLWGLRDDQAKYNLEIFSSELKYAAKIKGDEVMVEDGLVGPDGKNYGTGPFEIHYIDSDGNIVIELTIGEDAKMNGGTPVDDTFTEVEVTVDYDRCHLGGEEY